MNVTNQILTFVKFLNLNFELIKSQLETNKQLDEFEIEILLNNWLQFNWEILVEGSICEDDEFIEYYNEGADVFDDSYRIMNPNMEPTHKIICEFKSQENPVDLLSGNLIELSKNEFVCFVHFEGDKYSMENEFNCALFENEDGEFGIIKISSLIFSKFKLED